MAARCLVLSLVLLAGCKSEDAATSGGTSECLPPDWQREDGQCVPGGLPPDMPCPPGEWLRDADGACIPAGIPPDACGEGFVHDMDRGCEPILPAEDCPDGFMAIPGETQCREVAPCAPGVFGDIPVEPNTEYVDANYTGGASDGSPAAPWTSIALGIEAASPGAIVAIAAGSYAEDIDVQGKPVRLWGKCPALVELTGTGAGLATLFMRWGMNGSEVRRLTISGATVGVLLSGSEDVLLDELWIRDNGIRGVNAQDDYGPTSVSLKRSLLEDNHELGVFAGGASATVEATVVRDTVPAAMGFGRGIGAQPNPMLGTRATITLVRTLLERNQEHGVYVEGSDASVESTVVRDTSPGTQGIAGRGIGAQTNAATTAPANIQIARSLVERSQGVGVYISGSNATLEAIVVRGNVPDAQGVGKGIVAQLDPESGARTSLTLLRSLVEGNHGLGIQVVGSDATLAAVAVRDTLRGAGLGGRALQVESVEQSGTGSVVVGHSLFERSVEAGVFVAGAVNVDIDACVVRDSAATAGGLFGDGVVVASYTGPASATVTATRIEQSARAAISSFGARVGLGSSLLECQMFDIGAEIFQGGAAVLEDRGGVLCGCPEATERCKAQSYALAAPPPPE